MSFGSKPTPPDPTQTSNAQAGYNYAAAQQQNQINSYNQNNSFGSRTYTADQNSPSGYDQNTTLNPQLQGIFNNANSYYADPNNSNLNSQTGATANQLNNWSQQYLQPIFNQQQSNTNAQLQNQGLAPGSQAYNNAQNLLARNQGDVTNQYLQQNEGQAFNQALQQYQLPLSVERGLYGLAATPQGFGATPQAQIQPPNYAGVAEQNYQQENQAYGQGLSGMFGIGGALLKGGLGLIPGGSFFSGLFGGSGGGGYGGPEG